jgi:membrane protein DedA with SNARE-associated domain
VSVLRSFNALLAGASAMRTANFIAWTIAGGIAWPCVHGMFAYLLGNAASRLSGRLQIVLGVLAVGAVLWILRFVKRNEVRLEEVAMRSESYEQYHA